MSSLDEATKKLLSSGLEAFIISAWGEFEISEDVQLKTVQGKFYFAGVFRNGELASERFVARVHTLSDPKLWSRISREAVFCFGAHRSGIDQVCAPFRSQSGALVERYTSGDGDDHVEYAVLLMRRAHGSPLALASLSWARDTPLIRSVGTLLALLHRYSQSLALDGSLADLPSWRENLGGCLGEYKLHPEDAVAESEKDQSRYGIIHGDLNFSNVAWDNEQKRLDLFDWDQCQVGFYGFDLAQPLWGFAFFHLANPLGDASALGEPGLASSFGRTLLEGYKSVLGQLPVTLRPHLIRMLDLRKEQYASYCSKFLATADENANAGMKAFCQLVVDSLASDKLIPFEQFFPIDIFDDESCNATDLEEGKSQLETQQKAEDEHGKDNASLLVGHTKSGSTSSSSSQRNEERAPEQNS